MPRDWSIRWSSTTAIERSLKRWARTEEKNVLLHFGRVVFLSSSALGMLIRVNKKCKEFKIALKLCNISPEIFEVFKITSLNKVFDIHADAGDALKSFKPSGLLSHKHGETTYKLK